jgi:hypothetical protein
MMRRGGLCLVAVSIAGLLAAGVATSRPVAGPCQITQSKSLEGKVRTNLRFLNRTGGAVRIYWLDYAGRRVFYKSLAPGASYVQPTWKTHPWVVLDASGACIGFVIAPAAEYVIGALGVSTPIVGKKETFTAVVCRIAVGVGDSSCAAQVADTSPVRSDPPTGTVTFEALRGNIGASCVLRGTPGSPGIASCTVAYMPPSDLRTGEPPPVVAHYPGDASFEASTGGSSYIPASVVVPSTVSAATDGGIPTTLQNPNPFPISADEALTVPGTTHGVMLRVGERAKPLVIGKTSVKVRPLSAVAVKLKLNAAGRSLLAKRKTLKAVLTITTRAPGKPAKTKTKTVTIKAAKA